MRAAGPKDVGGTRVVACAAALFLTPAAAASSTPGLTWSGAERLVVRCQVSSEQLPVQDFQAALCTRAAMLARQAAPMPVELVSYGDPALVRPEVVTLIIQGALQRVSGRPALAFTMRPHRPASGDPVLFGTAPQVVPLSPALTVQSRPLDAALQTALSEVLPWRASPLSTRAPAR